MKTKTFIKFAKQIFKLKYILNVSLLQFFKF